MPSAILRASATQVQSNSERSSRTLQGERFFPFCCCPAASAVLCVSRLVGAPEEAHHRLEVEGRSAHISGSSGTRGGGTGREGRVSHSERMSSGRPRGARGARVSSAAAAAEPPPQNSHGVIDSLLSGWKGWGSTASAQPESLKPRARPVRAPVCVPPSV